MERVGAGLAPPPSSNSAAGASPCSSRCAGDAEVNSRFARKAARCCQPNSRSVITADSRAISCFSRAMALRSASAWFRRMGVGVGVGVGVGDGARTGEGVEGDRRQDIPRNCRGSAITAKKLLPTAATTCLSPCTRNASSPRTGCAMRA